MEFHPDREEYAHFTGPQRIDKALRTLEGIMLGVNADRSVSPMEIDLLKLWMTEHGEFSKRQPFDQLLPTLRGALSDGRVDDDEVEDVLHFCRRMRPGDHYFDAMTHDLQRLQGFISTIAADGQVTMAELDQLSVWLDEHEHLKTMWPYDEVVSLLLEVRRDRIIDPKEHALLVSFFSEFGRVAGHHVPNLPLNEAIGTVMGLCAVCPEIAFEGKTFCFTGTSKKVTRPKLAEVIARKGGTFSKNITNSVDYLVVGADGNPCWAYSCYGRKIEQAIALRKAGKQILIVYENDFWDAAPDELDLLRTRGD